MAKMSAASVAEAEKPAAPEPTGEMVIIDLGRHPRKRVNRLRKGEGRLMEKIEDAVDNLRSQKVLSAAPQTIVVIVRQDLDLRGLFGDDDEDDDDDDD